MSKGVTMRDIAKRLNVSAVSVSKAISGKDGVSESVREMILKTAKEMGYEYVSPKTDAKEHYNVGVMVSQNYFSDNAFYSRLFQNLAIEFGKLGYGCMLEIIHHKNEKEGILPMNAAGKMLDGLIVLGPMSDACLNNILRMDTPYVFVDNYSPEEIMDCVVSDNLYGSHVLTNYLIDKGHRKIAFVGEINATNSIMDRYLGYLKAMMQHHLPIRQDYLLPDRTADGLFKEIELPDDMPEAFVCNCDEIAYRLAEQLKKKKVRIPEDVSVVGFDDYIFATLCTPQLTTFRVDMEEMSRVAVQLMVDRLKTPHKVSGRRVISGEIIIRDSVADRLPRG